MSKYVTVSPAYGRDYRSARAAQEDWLDGKDFMVETVGPDMGRMINIPQAEETGLKIMIRYKRKTQVCQAPAKFYRAHVFTHGTDADHWVASRNFLKRPSREEIEDAMKELHHEGRFEVRVAVVQGTEERGGWGWLQDGVTPASAEPAAVSSGTGCRHCAGGNSGG
jgi:hypothetical protein